ncbi:hypothetical protein GS444_05875 [Rhodococcus hoagii]|nr:hypothetical protein [Prescottella equi]
MGRSELLDQDRYRTVEARNRNIDELYVLLEELLEKRSTEDWLKILDELDVPAMPISSVDDLFDDEHLTAVDFFHEVLDSERDLPGPAGGHTVQRLAVGIAPPGGEPRPTRRRDRRRRAMAGRRVTAAAS